MFPFYIRKALRVTDNRIPLGLGFYQVGIHVSKRFNKGTTHSDATTFLMGAAVQCFRLLLAPLSIPVVCVLTSVFG